MSRNIRLEDMQALVHTAFVLFVLIATSVVSVVINIGSVALGGEMSQIPGLPIAMVGVWLTFAVGYVWVRSRKRWDTLDKVGMGTMSLLPFLVFFVEPIRQALSPVIGLFVALSMIGSYFVTVIR